MFSSCAVNKLYWIFPNNKLLYISKQKLIDIYLIISSEGKKLFEKRSQRVYLTQRAIQYHKQFINSIIYSYLFHSSSVVEQSAVNRSVVGSNPTCGAINITRRAVRAGRRSTIGNRVDRYRSQGFKSLALRHYNITGPLVKRLRHRPFTAVTRVRVP